MLAHEWRELQTLCEHIGDLRHRCTAAQRTKNAGLVAGLKDELVQARRQRELLVRHIAASLGSAAAGQPHLRRARRKPAAAARAERAAPRTALAARCDAADPASPVMIIGFSEP